MADLEWEVRHTKSSLHKGRGPTPEAALRDLRGSFETGIGVTREDVDREQKRLEKLDAMLADLESTVRA